MPPCRSPLPLAPTPTPAVQPEDSGSSELILPQRESCPSQWLRPGALFRPQDRIFCLPRGRGSEPAACREQLARYTAPLDSVGEEHGQDTGNEENDQKSQRQITRGE